MNKSKLIGELVEIPPVKTVISLKDGRTDSGEIAGSFVFTSEVSSHFTVISDSLLGHRGQGYFLQGDFGSGKSHFLAAVYTLLEGIEGADVLKGRHGGLRRVMDSGKSFLPVPVSLVNYRAKTPFERIVVEAIETALISRGIEAVLTPLASFLNYLKGLLEEHEAAESFVSLIGSKKTGGLQAEDLNADDLKKWIDDPNTDNIKKWIDDPSTDNIKMWIDDHPQPAYMYGMRLIKSLGFKTPETLIEERYETFNRAISAVKKAGFDGLFLLIDELSEFFRSKPAPHALNEDARTLQLLGELTANEPLWIIAAVQESIESTGDISQVTFRKIKDRFPVKLTLSTVHIRSLISQRLVRQKQGAEEEIYRIYENYRRQFSNLPWTYESFRQTYPVHPVTISLLDGLGELFSEHRGIVDFVYSRIAGDKRRNIRGILQQPAAEILTPDSIYDHFTLRLAEFSAFNIYPRHVIPHLDEVIESVIENEDDRVLARRLVRILVLYKIHPTADTPTVGQLAEIAACSLDFQMPGFNSQFIAEALLDPIVEASRFLVKRTSESGNVLDTVYSIITQDDPGKILKSRIDRTAGDLGPEDSRLLTEAFADIQESQSWPAGSLWERGTTRLINWNFSTRKVFVGFLHDKDMPDRLAYEISSGEFDFAFIITFGKKEYSADHTAVWQVPFPQKKAPLFKEFLATRIVASELKPSNPADSPLIQPAEERLERLKPAVHQAALELFNSGEFTIKEIQVGAAVRQLKRFDRLLEAAGEVVLNGRYPKFREIAPRRIHPSPRLYQRLLDEFVTPGGLPLREAQTKALGEAIDGLAVPLGLVELKGGSYLFSPDITGNSFLAYFFGMLNPAGSTPLTEVRLKLKTGAYGLPEDTVLFLLSALASSGLITLLKNSRAIPADFLNFVSAEKADAVAPGELINQNDRETLQRECSFLAPSSIRESFGLRRQREIWKAAIKFKETASILAMEIRSRLSQVAEFSAFKVFDLSATDQKLGFLTGLADEIKPSYSAKEGLERFLRVWRGTGLESEDIQFLKKFDGFLSQNTEQFVFINHYLQHSAVEKAAKQDGMLKELHREVLSLFDKPEIFIAGDEGKQLNLLFSRFRECYITFYSKKHEEYYQSYQKYSISKSVRRAFNVLDQLSAIETLDRPPGLEQFLRDIKTAGDKQCRRRMSEELIRSPVCTCGFQPGDVPEQGEPEEPEQAIHKFFMEYIDIIKNPDVLESITARAYAVQDADPDMSGRLKQISKIVQEDRLTPAHLLDIIDEQTALQVSRALAGKVSIQQKKLSELISRLAGRRLTQRQVRKIVDEWAGAADENTLLAIEEDHERKRVPVPPAAGSMNWWPLLHERLFARDFQPEPVGPEGIRVIENGLEKQFPSDRLKEDLQHLDTESLLRFITRERFHTRAVQAAWRLLSERIITGSGWPREGDIHSSHLDHDRAGEIQEHLGMVKMIAERLNQGYPECLTMRIFTEKLMFDAWTTDELQWIAKKAVQEVSEMGEEWILKLSEVSSISLDDFPVVVIVDGVAPDVWIESIKGVEYFKDSVSRSWARLTGRPDTVDSIAQLFGFNKDPVEEFSTRNIVYHNLKGNEERALLNHVLPIQPDRPVVIRLAMIDRAAHDRGMRLSDMAGILRNILETGLPPLLDACRHEGRRLILTTDHGLSLTSKGLLHGKGGVYERTIFRAEWGES